MSSLKKISAGVALALACAATVAQAAPTLTITPVYLETRQISPALNLTKVDLTNPTYSGTNYFHRFDLMLSISGLGAADDLGGATINVDLGTAFGPHTSTWSANNPMVTILDDLGDPVQKPQFGTNGDPGADLQAITMLLESDVAFGTQFGEGTAKKVGTANVKWLSGTAATLKLSPAAGNWLNLFVNNSGAPGGFATAFTSANANFVTGEVQFGSSGPAPTYVALASTSPASDPNSPDFAYQYHPMQDPTIVLPAGTAKGEIQFGDLAVAPDGSLYALFWLQGTAADIAAVKAQFANISEAGGVPVENVGPGLVYDNLVANFPGFNMALKFDGMAGALDGGSLAFDFSGNNGLTVAKFAAVPEPASLLSLGGLSFLGLALGRRRR